MLFQFSGNSRSSRFPQKKFYNIDYRSELVQAEGQAIPRTLTYFIESSITVLKLIFCSTALDSVKQVNMLSCYISKTAEFNQVKQDVSRKVILPLINEFSLDQTIRGFPNASNNWRQKCFVYYVPSDHRHSRHSQRIRLHGRAHLAAEVHVRARTSGSVSGRRKHFIRHRGNDDLLAGVQLESARVRARFSH